MNPYDDSSTGRRPRPPRSEWDDEYPGGEDHADAGYRDDRGGDYPSRRAGEPTSPPPPSGRASVGGAPVGRASGPGPGPPSPSYGPPPVGPGYGPPPVAGPGYGPPPVGGYEDGYTPGPSYGGPPSYGAPYGPEPRVDPYGPSYDPHAQGRDPYAGGGSYD